MASQGEIVYKQAVVKLVEKIAMRFITGHETQSIGRFFWSLLCEEYKDVLKEEKGRQAFWYFAQNVKYFLVNRELGTIYDLWNHFDQNGKNLFETFYDNCLNKLVCEVL